MEENKRGCGISFFFHEKEYFTFTFASKENIFYDGDYLERIPIGNIMIEVANSNRDKIKNFIAKIFIETFKSCMGDQTCIDVSSDELSNIIAMKIFTGLQEEFNLSRTVSQLICLELVNELSVSEDENFFLVLEKFFSNIEKIIDRANYFLSCNNPDEKFWNCDHDIRMRFGYDSETSRIDIVYSVLDLMSFIVFDLIQSKKNATVIKTCENCGKYFTPTARSDEIYCDNTYKDNKTCKQIGYENKLKKNEFKTEYRRAYKTQRARIKYNSHIPNYEELHFSPWEVAAKEALKNFSDSKDIDGFRNWLKNNKDSF